MEDRRDDLVAVETPEVDPVALAGRVRAAAARLGVSAGTSAPVGGSVVDEEGTAGPWVHPAAASAEILPYAELPGGALSALKKAVRRALRWYLWPVTAQLSGHNRAVAEVLAEQQRQLAVARLDAERVARDADLAGRR